MTVNQKRNEMVNVGESIEMLKDEVQSIKNLLKNMEDTILKDRLNSVENALAQNRLLLYAIQLDEEMKNDFFKLMKNDCESKDECTKRVTKIFSNILTSMKELNIEQGFDGLDAFIAKSDELVKNPQKQECLECFERVNHKLKREKRTFQTIGSLEKILKKESQYEIDIPFVIKSFLEPMSNKNRLIILSNLYTGKKSFSELSIITRKTGGPLIFHLNKLLKARLITQENNQGDYIITQRGIEAFDLLSTIKNPCKILAST